MTNDSYISNLKGVIVFSILLEIIVIPPKLEGGEYNLSYDYCRFWSKKKKMKI